MVPDLPFAPSWGVIVLKNFFTSEDGVTSIEYALMAAVIALAIITAVASTGTENGGVWSRWTTLFMAAVGDS